MWTKKFEKKWSGELRQRSNRYRLKNKDKIKNKQK